MSLGDRIRGERILLNLTQKELATRINVSPQVISNWEREYTIPDLNDIFRLAEVFDCSTDYLLGNFSLEEPRKRSKTVELIPANDREYAKNAIIPDSDMVKIPVLGSIRAGQPMEMVRETAPEYTYVEKSVVGTHEAFVLSVTGESMSGDNIHDGDRVVIIRGVDYTSTDICAVSIDNEEATLKRVKQQGDLCMLRPSNPDMEPMLFPASEVHVIGVVVEHRRRMR